jgi:hypothetical protein
MLLAIKSIFSRTLSAWLGSDKFIIRLQWLPSGAEPWALSIGHTKSPKLSVDLEGLVAGMEPTEASLRFFLLLL